MCQVTLAIILKTAVQDDKVMQDFESESLPNRGGQFPNGKVPPVGSDSGSKSCVNLSSSTAVFRIMIRHQAVSTILEIFQFRDKLGVIWELFSINQASSCHPGRLLKFVTELKDLQDRADSLVS